MEALSGALDNVDTLQHQTMKHPSKHMIHPTEALVRIQLLYISNKTNILDKDKSRFEPSWSPRMKADTLTIGAMLLTQLVVMRVFKYQICTLFTLISRFSTLLAENRILYW